VNWKLNRNFYFNLRCLICHFALRAYDEGNLLHFVERPADSTLGK